MDTLDQNDIVSLDPEQPFWARFYMVSPLVVIGTRNEADGDYSLLIGKVKAVHLQKEALRVSEQEDDKVIRDNPLLAYLSPDRYAAIDETNAFPFPAGFQK